jgi:hypothetical protein
MHPAIHPAEVTLCAAPGSRPGEFRVWARDAAQLLCMNGLAEIK